MGKVVDAEGRVKGGEYELVSSPSFTTHCEGAKNEALGHWVFFSYSVFLFLHNLGISIITVFGWQV